MSMTLNYGDLQGFKIEKTELKDALKCLERADSLRNVLHSDLLQYIELSDKHKGISSEYMRSIRYWNFLTKQIILFALSKQWEEME